MLLGLALAALAGLTSVGTASATSLSYTFGSSNQGWVQTQDQASTSVPPPAGFALSDGNPGGHLTAKDSGDEDGCSTATSPCELLTFISPFVLTLGANYGGTGSFDLRSKDVDPAFAAELLLLPSGSLYLDGLITEASGTDYHHLSIPLNETGNWTVCPYGGGSCHSPSQPEFMNLIAATDQIAVMADVGPDGIGETYDLDNVSLTNGPPPQSPASPTPPAQHKKKKCKKKHKRSASAAKKKCKKKKKHRRAAVVRFRG
jgi:hypothetical protein